MAVQKPDEATLDALVSAARAGSRDAFGDLWRHLSPVVAGYVRGRGVANPDDVTSEVFLAAFQRLPGFEGDGAAFRRWLFTIAHHRAVDDTRRQVRAKVEEPYEPAADPRVAASAESGALLRFGTEEAMALLAGLPEDQRNVLLLRVLGDLPVADVAQVLDRSPDAVRQLQHRALARLRRDAEGRAPQSGAGRAVTGPAPEPIAEA